MTIATRGRKVRRGHQARKNTTEAPKETAQERIVAAVGAVQSSEAFLTYLKAASRFHTYSWSNQLLISLQRPEATRVAGYRTWLGLGRQVQKGEKAIKIVVPFRKTDRWTETDEATGEETEHAASRIKTFGLGSVFDVSQTDGDPLPEAPVVTLQGEGDTAFYRRLLVTAERLGCAVTETGLRGAHGDYDPQTRAIRLEKADSGAQHVKTLVHELCHHATALAVPGLLQNYHTDLGRTANEVVAELAAYVVCDHFGVDTSEYSAPYVATWLGTRKVDTLHLKWISDTARTLIAEVAA